MSAKPGRNDPCWCGGGSKYKKCHLQSDEAAARERAHALAEARREAAGAAAPSGVVIRKPESPSVNDGEDADDRFQERWAKADTDERAALLREAVAGPEVTSAEWIFAAFDELMMPLREAGRSAELDALVDLLRERRADCVDLDGGFYEITTIENGLLRGDDVSERFEASAREIVLDVSGLGLIELLAFRDHTELLLRVLPPVLGSLAEAFAEQAEDILATRSAGEEADEDDEDEEAESDEQGGVQDSAFLLADIEIARALSVSPSGEDVTASLLASLQRYLPVDREWFQRVVQHARGTAPPPPEKELASDDEVRMGDAVVLSTHNFAAWLADRVDWPLGRRALARMCLADALLLHVESLRRPSRRSLMLSANTLLRYAGDGEHPASSVALLTVGAWWNAWLTELGWIDPIEASRELRVLRREWPSMIGTAGATGGDPVLGAALRTFWDSFPTPFLEPKGSIPPPR